MPRAQALAREAAGEPLARALARAGLLGSDVAARALAELARVSHGCAGCGFRADYQALAQLPALTCPRCGQRLGREPSARLSGSHASSILPSRRATSSRRDESRQATSGRPYVPLRDTAGGVAGGPGRTFGPYTLISEIGRGGNGVVWLAKRPGLDRYVALKELKEADAADAETLARFGLEAKVGSKLRHPGIVPVFDVGQAEGAHYYVMEYCPGPTLKERLRDGPLRPGDAAELVAALARAMAAAHEQGVIHRDLKPANIILHEDRPRIMDFGLARDRSLLRSMTQTGDIIGTPYYMSPEQFRGERELDHRVDLYALGVILYECLTGRRPYVADSAYLLGEKVCRGDVERPTAVVEAVPPALEAACLRAMAVDPDDRYPTAQALVEALERWSDPAEAAAGPTAARRPSPAAAAVALAILLAGAAVAAVVAIGRSRSAGGGSDAAGATPAPAAVGAAQLLAEAGADLEERVARRDPAPYPEVEERLRRSVELAEGGEAAAARLALARYLVRRGRYGEALAPLEPLARAAAGRPGQQALLLRARAEEALGRRREAVSTYASLVDADSGGVVGLTAGAARARLGGSYEDAAELVESALALAPDFTPALLERARCLVELPGDAAARGAEEALRAARAAGFDDPLLHVLQALVWIRRGHPEQSQGPLEAADRLREAGPAPLLLRARGLVALARGDAGAARGAFDRVLEGPEVDCELLVHRGFAWWVDEQRLEAREDWKRARALDGERFRRAVAAWHGALPEEASQEGAPDQEERASQVDLWREAFGTSQEPAPAVEQALGALLGPVDHRSASLSPARAEFIASRLDGVSGFVGDDLRAVIEAAVRGQDEEDLRFALARSRRSGGDDPRVLVELARVLAGRDRCDEALEALAAARAAGAAGPDLQRLEGEVRWRSGRPIPALRALDAAAEADPDGIEGRCAAAEAALLRLELETARREAEAALEVDPTHLGAQKALAVALHLEGETERALQLVRRVYEREGAADSRVLAFYALHRNDVAPSPGAVLVAAELAVGHPERSSPPGRAARRLSRYASQLTEAGARAAWLRGRYALVSGGSREEVLRRWRSARQVDPTYPLTEAEAAAFRRRFGEEPGPLLR